MSSRNFYIYDLLNFAFLRGFAILNLNKKSTISIKTFQSFDWCMSDLWRFNSFRIMIWVSWRKCLVIYDFFSFLGTWSQRFQLKVSKGLVILLVYLKLSCFCLFSTFVKLVFVRGYIILKASAEFYLKKWKSQYVF